MPRGRVIVYHEVLAFIFRARSPATAKAQVNRARKRKLRLSFVVWHHRGLAFNDSYLAVSGKTLKASQQGSFYQYLDCFHGQLESFLAITVRVALLNLK